MTGIEEKSLNELAEKTLRSFNKSGNNIDLPDLNISAAPIVGLVDKIINNAILQNVSDIHFEPREKNMCIRVRIDGILKDYVTLPSELHQLIISRIKIISCMNTVEKRKPQDGSMSYKYAGKTIDIRISTIPTIHGEKLVMRLLNILGRCFTVEELELNYKNEASFRKLFHRPSGLILNTGPVNSGKTATLYAALNELNTPEKNIVTIEDPVEYKLDNITQIQINEKTGLSFEEGMRAVLRQDPDIIFIGEIRDEKTAATAVRAALTGHLVLSTLHTGNAVSAILRMLDMKIEPYLLAEVLAGCLSQRLLRRICPHCKISYEPVENSEQYIFMQKYAIKQAFRGKGCAFCGNSGYFGRIAVQEILTVKASLKKSICLKDSSSVMKEIAVGDEMVPLFNDGIEKIIRGKTTISEIMRVINEDECQRLE
ncbi:GspE/PulE family protein [Pectinatus haikarae]|uniref:Type IV pilus assembly protein PilB n=1 Tax=Pectinatus haikarae TaxID=349096 RepID=A0ABT9YAG7_9FIRM|nr:GspE/PulE family protein [Pectinatus haikarae]MDQ0204192.1 type IV pilus assembly protein PilB [Pectinatus haikarae]